MTSSKILLYFCLSFIAGIFLSSIGKITQLLMLGFLISGILLISVFWKNKKSVTIGFCIFFLVLGIWRGKIPDSGQALEAEVEAVGIIISEPDISIKSQKLTVKTGEKILVTTGLYPKYEYGDKLEITGNLEMPSEDINGFNYKNYLAKDGIYSIMSFPEIELIGHGFGNPIMKVLFSFKNKFKNTAENFISPPEVGILEALIFGDEGQISKEWQDKLNLTGTRHIAAVSGMNITIIASLILAMLLSLGLWRQQAFYLSIGLLVLYILMIGAPSSIGTPKLHYRV